MSRVAGKSPANGAADSAARAQKAARAAAGDVVEFRGEKFRLEPGELPGAAQMILTHFAAMDPGVRDPDAEDGMYQVLEMLLARPSGVQPGEEGFDPAAWAAGDAPYDPGEFRRFMRHAGKTRAPLEEIVAVMQRAVEIVAARPTGRPPGSSDGRPAITASSTVTSSAGPAEDSSG
jgi:hypothetical protein